MAKLTYKNKQLVKEYVKTHGNGTQAALRVYNTKDPNTAAVIASRELRKDNVKEELRRILEKEDRTIGHVADNIADIANTKPQKLLSGTEVLEANKTLLKLHGVLTDRKTVTSYNMNIDYKDLSTHELVQLRNKKKRETDTILADDSTSTST